MQIVLTDKNVGELRAFVGEIPTKHGLPLLQWIATLEAREIAKARAEVDAKAKAEATKSETVKEGDAA